MTLEDMKEEYPDSMKADGYDEAVVGIDALSHRVIYSIRVVVDILVKQGMSFDEAMEYFEYNMQGAYVGARTPIWCWPVSVEP